MDQYLELVLNWFKQLGITKVDEDKLKRQLSIITNWFKHNGIGVLEAVTGFGKTMVAIITIYRLNLKYPDAKINIVVPSIKLLKDWEDNVETFKLKNVSVYVVNTYVLQYQSRQTNWECDLLVCDEVHNYLSDDALMFNQTIKCTKFKMFLGLSATLDDKEKNVLERLQIPIIDKVTLSEAKRFNYISDYIVYNIGIELNPEESEKYARLNDIHNSNYSKFNFHNNGEHNWELAQACSVGASNYAKVNGVWKTGAEWRSWYAQEQGWNKEADHPWSPQNIAKYANQWSWAMRNRKDFLYKHNSKIDKAIEIINLLNVSTITFAETTEFADELATRLGDKARAYHTNLKPGFEKEEVIVYRKQLTAAKKLALQYNGKIGNFEEIKGYPIKYYKEKKISAIKLRKIALSLFENKEITTLCTAKALDEGLNIEGIECAIICSASSKKRQYVQRMGRGLRFIEGKVAKIVNLYIKNTQDEAWLKKRQKGDINVRWIENLTDIL
ncbi:MAG: DEAD/DEAH box helicase [Pseudanabaena sp.]